LYLSFEGVLEKKRKWNGELWRTDKWLEKIT